VVVGLVGLIAALARPARSGVDRGAVLAAAAVGLGTAAVIAAVLHGEVRYLAPAYPWLWVAASPGLAGLAGTLPGGWPRAAAAVLVLGLAASAVGAVQGRNREAKGDLASVVAAAGEVAGLAAGRPCLVVANRVPQFAWYSGCEARPFDLDEVRLPAPAGRPTFVLLVAGDPRQPEGELLSGYLAVVGEPLSIVEGCREVSIYQVSESSGQG